MANKRLKPVEIDSKLRQVEVLMDKACPIWMQSDGSVLLNKPITAGVRSTGKLVSPAHGWAGIDHVAASTIAHSCPINSSSPLRHSTVRPGCTLKI